jgi:hypothetical protein
LPRIRAQSEKHELCAEDSEVAHIGEDNVKEYQKISLAASLHAALHNLSEIEALLEHSRNFNEIVRDDVSPKKRESIRRDVRETRRIIEAMFEHFGLSVREISCKQSIAAHVISCINSFYELAQFQQKTGKLPEQEAQALEKCCAAITQHLEHIRDIL